MTDFAVYAWTVDNSMCIYETISISIDEERYKITGIIMYYPVSFLLQIKYVIPYVAFIFHENNFGVHCIAIPSICTVRVQIDVRERHDVFSQGERCSRMFRC